MKALLVGSVEVSGVIVRFVEAESGTKPDRLIWAVASDIEAVAKSKGCPQRPLLASVLRMIDDKGENPAYTFKALFEIDPRDFCSRNAQLLNIEMLEAFLILTGMKHEEAKSIMTSFVDATIAKIAEHYKKDNEEKTLTDSDRITKLSLELLRLNAKIKRMGDHNYDSFIRINNRLDALEKSIVQASPAGREAAEIRKAASMLYARSKQLEGQ